MQAPTRLQRASAEAFGTFALVTGGCGAIIVNHATGALGHGGVAASFGLVIMVMIAALGHLSGAHFNPAMTLAFALGLLGGADRRSSPRGNDLSAAPRTIDSAGLKCPGPVTC
jgi:hypothetical protein